MYGHTSRSCVMFAVRGPGGHVHRRALAAASDFRTSVTAGPRPSDRTAVVVTLRSDLQPRVRRQQLAEHAVRPVESHDDPAPEPHHLRGEIDEVPAEALPLPAHDLGRQGKLRDPLAEI